MQSKPEIEWLQTQAEQIIFPKLCPLQIHYGRCLLLVLRIRSAHLGIFGFLKEFAANTTIFLHDFWLCGKSRSWQGLSESKKKIGGNHAFFRDN